MADGKPDAILMNHDFDPGGKGATPRDRVFDYLESTLGAKPVYVNTTRFFQQDDGAHLILASPSPHDTLFHPSGHPREKTHRYDWREGDRPGCQFGTLRDDAWRCHKGTGRQVPA